MAEKKSLVPKENNPKLRAEVERIKKKEALKKSLKKLSGPLGKIIGMTANQIADKYTGKTMFRLFGELQNKKKIFGDKFEEVKKKLAKAKKLRTQQIEMGEVSDRLSEDLPKASLRKSGGKVKKLKSGGRVGAPRGTGAALRGFGKGYK
jgi:hypothetical protein